MDKEQFSKLLLEQQEKGKALLSLLLDMHESKNDFGDGMAIVGEVELYYVPEDELDRFLNKFEEWKSYVSELLKTQFGTDDQYVYDWDSNIGTYISKSGPILPQLKKKVNKGQSLIDSFLQRLDFHFHDDDNVENALKQRNMVKHPKIFISHKTEDKPFVDELMKMLEFIVGPNTKRIFCSSSGGYDIKLGKEILSELKRQFEEFEMIFLIVHSPRYYTSPICLNEMGAAWILGSKFFSFLTSDCPFSLLKGVIDSKYISIKVNDSQETVVSKLNDFKDYLLDVFEVDKEGFNNTKWESVRNDFILQTSSMKYVDRNSVKDDKNSSLPAPKALVMAELVGKDPYMVNIVNRGEGDAEHLKINLSKDCENMLISGMDLFPFENLKAGKYVSLKIYPCIGDPQILRMTFTWEEKGIEYSASDFVKI